MVVLWVGGVSEYGRWVLCLVAAFSAFVAAFFAFTLANAPTRKTDLASDLLAEVSEFDWSLCGFFSVVFSHLLRQDRRLARYVLLGLAVVHLFGVMAFFHLANHAARRKREQTVIFTKTLLGVDGCTVFFSFVAVFLTGYWCGDNTLQQLQEGFENKTLSYALSRESKVFVDGVQSVLDCCGVTGYVDEWFSKPGMRGAVPHSCCNKISTVPCIYWDYKKYFNVNWAGGKSR